MLKRLISIALFAGLLAGVGSTAFQMVYAVPLILEAEEFEVAEDPVATSGVVTAEHDHADGHSHDGAWAPADGLERAMSTFGANVFASMGFALLMVAAFHLWGGTVTGRSGILWGGAGFVSFSLAPFFGLPPELPGMVGADLASRQIWWVFTVSATVGGLALLALPLTFLVAPLRVVIGLLLLVAPHAIGAPQLAVEADLTSLVPAHLSAQFAVVALAHGLVFWLLLGGISGWLFDKWNVLPQLGSAQSSDF